MKKELRDYLITIGMRSSVTDQDAWAFYRSLTGENYTKAREIRGNRQATGGGGNGDGGEEEPAEQPAGDTPPQQRSEQTPTPPVAPTRAKICGKSCLIGAVGGGVFPDLSNSLSVGSALKSGIASESSIGPKASRSAPSSLWSAVWINA